LLQDGDDLEGHILRPQVCGQSGSPSVRPAPIANSEFVVAAAQVLQEGVAGDHDLRCPVGLESAHTSQPALELTLIDGLSYREVEALRAERGIEVDHVTVYRWVQRFT
jgi:hypothetical protein